MVFIKDDVARCYNIVGVKVIDKISFGMWFQANKDAWMGSRVKLLSMGFKGPDVTQTTEYPKVRDITWMLIQLFIRRFIMQKRSRNAID